MLDMVSAASVDAFRHRQLIVDGAELHVVEAGDADAERSLLFLHGWPEDWSAYAGVMTLAAHEVHALAIDLPGIGGSTTHIANGEKTLIAKYVRGVIDALALRNVTLVGHDAGGMVAYACLREFPERLASVVIASVVIPGLDPWDEVRRNPMIFHWALHAVPELPELLVMGKQGPYFDFFYNAIAAHPEAISASDRQRFVAAYATPSALSAGFDWFRAFPRDAEYNRREQSALTTPLCYMRGEKDPGDIAVYLKSFRAAGIQNLSSARVPDSGHFTPEEQPAGMWQAIREFLKIT